MKKLDLDQIVNYLDAYENGELDELEKYDLKDDLLDLSEQLYREGIVEGRKYERMIIIVKENDDLPQPYTRMKMKSYVTNAEYDIQIKEITGLRRNEEGDLIVEVLAKKIKY